MIPRELIDRINELARKSRAEGLSDSEKAEQKALRERYLCAIRIRAKDAIESIVVEEPDKTRHKLPRKN